MWDTASPRTSWILRIAWGLGALVCVIAMIMYPARDTIPFHLIWIGLSLVYGFAVWRPIELAATVVVVSAVTGTILVHHAVSGHIHWQEIFEVPLSVVLIVVIAAHIRRRHIALTQLAAVAELDRKQAERRQELMRQISHELRTPITVARGYTELLRDDCTDPRLVEDATIVLDELDKLERIAGRLLALAWAHEADGADLVDIEALAHRVTRRWAPVTNRPMHSELLPANAMGHEDRLETAVDCLVENAIAHTGNLASIVLRTYRVDGWAVLEVEDDGPGMTAKPAPLDANHGLGLTIVRGVIDVHGGQLLFGQGPGGGLRVTIRLPALPR